MSNVAHGHLTCNQTGSVYLKLCFFVSSAFLLHSYLIACKIPQHIFMRKITSWKEQTILNCALYEIATLSYFADFSTFFQSTTLHVRNTLPLYPTHLLFKFPGILHFGNFQFYSINLSPWA